MTALFISFVKYYRCIPYLTSIALFTMATHIRTHRHKTHVSWKPHSEHAPLSASTSSGFFQLSTRHLNLAAESRCHSATRGLMRSSLDDAEVWVSVPGHLQGAGWQWDKGSAWAKLDTKLESLDCLKYRCTLQHEGAWPKLGNNTQKD